MTIHMRVHTSLRGLLPGVYPESFQFPGGEWHLRDIPSFPEDEKVTLIADVRGADAVDLLKAALWSNVAGGTHGFILMLPYLPAARADRGVPLGARVYAKMIGSMDADAVIGLDPHSEMITEEIRNLKIADHHDLVIGAIGNDRLYDALICPDKGAIERTEALAARMGLDVYYAEKHRDFETGKITGIEIPKPPPAHGRYLIADDICDGGGTFMGLADALPSDRLGLWVTHGIFSGKADRLRGSFEHIYTTDSHPGHNRVGVATTIVPCFHSMFDATHL